MAQTGTSKKDKYRDKQALYTKDLYIYYPIGSLLYCEVNEPKQREVKKFYATVVNDYEHFVNVRIDCNNGSSYVMSLNKRDIIRNDLIMVRRVK